MAVSRNLNKDVGGRKGVYEGGRGLCTPRTIKMPVLSTNNPIMPKLRS
jgi:hypothetical protein